MAKLGMPNIVFLKVPPLAGAVAAGPVGAGPVAGGDAAGIGRLPVSCVFARLRTGSPAAGATPRFPPHALHCWTFGDCGVPQCGQGTMLTVTGIVSGSVGDA